MLRSISSFFLPLLSSLRSALLPKYPRISMAAFDYVATIHSVTSAPVRASCDCLSWMASSDDVGSIPAMPGMLESTTTTTCVHRSSWPLRTTSLRFDGISHEAVSTRVLILGIAQLISALFLLYQLGESLIVRAFATVSHAVATIKCVETHIIVCNSSNEMLTKRCDWLQDQLLSQQDRIAHLNAESESYKRTIAELSTRIEADKKAVESVGKSFKLLRLSVEGKGARISGVKADTARRIHVLESRVTEIQGELNAVKMEASPPDVSSTFRTAKGARTFAGIDRRLEHADFMREVEELCVEMSGSAARPASTVTGDVCLALEAESVVMTRDNSRSKKIKVKKPKTFRKPLSTLCENVVQSYVPPSPGPPPTTPLPPLPTEAWSLVKDSGKETRSCKSSSMVQCLQKTHPGAGQLDVEDRVPRATSKTTQSGIGLSWKTPAASGHRKSMLPMPGKSLFPRHGTSDVDGSSPHVVGAAGCFASQSESTIPLRLPKTAEDASVGTPPSSPSRSRLPRSVERERIFRLPTSTSLAALDAALQAMQVADSSCDDLLGPLTAIDHPEDDFDFVSTAPISPITTKRESVRVAPNRENAKVKLESRPLKRVRHVDSWHVSSTKLEVTVPIIIVTSPSNECLP